ncbi:hypothetical protein [Microbacterium sp. NC79]|uniref:PIN-like domain-containing protein n=1 Tax=Microbacterium sp. NC79 TaxID=2851009 RepID=UPI001C2C1A05|nr:hypothetical protein [Microbacterium sp. NC79]MBV0896101.1 hypothetical protein [Microbacterium sp. NC79]
MQAAQFLLDRSVGGAKLVTRLREAGWDAATLAEQFGDQRAQQMRDEEWIREGTARGFILLSKDHRIALRPLEAEAVYVNDARLIAFARGDMTAETMGDLCIRYEASIFRLAVARAPFVFSLGQAGLKRKQLHRP